MNNQKLLEKQYQWYFNPLEQIRMLRYFPLQSNFSDVKINHNVVYDKEPMIGLTIYVDQNTVIDQLTEILQSNHKLVKICVFNSGGDSIKLANICKYYQVDIINQKQKLFNQMIGNSNILDWILNGLTWSKDSGVDILTFINSNVKLVQDWNVQLSNLAINSDMLTFVNNIDDNMWTIDGIKLFAINVHFWNINSVLYGITWLIQNEYTVRINSWLQSISHIIASSNYSQKYVKYKVENNLNYFNNHYVSCKDLLKE